MYDNMVDYLDKQSMHLQSTNNFISIDKCIFLEWLCTGEHVFHFWEESTMLSGYLDMFS